jgi:chemotaxis protein CheX
MQTSNLRKDNIRYVEDAEFSADLTANILSADHTTNYEESSFAFSSDSRLLAYLCFSVCEVFGRTVEVESSHQETYLFARNSRLLGTVSAVMEMSGDLSARVAVSFPPDLARLVTAKIAGCTPEELTEEDLTDGVGEVVNQISGRARTFFQEAGFQISIGLPQLHFEEGLPFEYQGNSSCYAMIYECLGFRFALQISPTASLPLTESR